MNHVAKETLHLPVCLIIMDGYGLAEPNAGNAITQAKTPCLDTLFANHSHATLEASGEAVGLPVGQMGNSEVGHLNIGAGRVVFQELTRINRACFDGSLVENPVLLNAMNEAKTPGAALHLMGLLSDGGVHSSNEHLYALLELAVAQQVPEVFIHCFMDGRDVPPSSGLGFIKSLEAKIQQLAGSTTQNSAVLSDRDTSSQGSPASDEPVNAENDTCGDVVGGTVISIASISGRYFAMDRDNRWDRVEQAYETIVRAQPYCALSPVQVMQNSYDAGITDEFVAPVALHERGIKESDSVIFFNFRPDRAREITRALVDDSFNGFERTAHVPLHFVCLTEYDPTIAAAVAFKKDFPDHVLADVLADANLIQYHIAETEKYAHITFFLNGGIEKPKAGEIRKLIASPSVATYDLQPEMSEPEVAHALAAAIDASEADVYLVNFANCDMVGHTGSIPAAISAVEAVDAGVAHVLAALERRGGVALLTADHGNADKMLEPDNTPFTAHTTALVPLVLIDYSSSNLSLKAKTGALCNIAPTLLDIIGLQKPEAMVASSLLDHNE